MKYRSGHRMSIFKSLDHKGPNGFKNLLNKEDHSIYKKTKY